MLPGEQTKIGNPIANKDVTVEFFLSGRYTNEFMNSYYFNNPDVIENDDLIFYDEFQEMPEPIHSRGLVKIDDPVFYDDFQETPDPVTIDNSQQVPKPLVFEDSSLL